MIADIASYSDFIPWIEASRLWSQDGELLGELFVCFKGFRDSYTSIVELDKEAGTVEASLKEGAFKHLYSVWNITHCDDGCKVDFRVEFAFKSRMLESMMGGMFKKANTKMIEAFKTRSEELYGN